MFFHVLYASFKDGVVPDLYNNLRVQADSVEEAVEIAVMDLEEIHTEAMFYADPGEVVGVPKAVAVLDVETGEVHSVQHIESPYVKHYPFSKESKAVEEKIVEGEENEMKESIKQARKKIEQALKSEFDPRPNLDTYAVIYLVEDAPGYAYITFPAASAEDAVLKAKKAFKDSNYPIMLVAVHNWNTEERTALNEGYIKY